MIPILFNKDEKTFTSLGLGQMDATLVEVERERNGNYTLYAEVPFNSPQAKHLTKEMLIKADAGSRTKWQTFKINRTIKDTNADVIKVYADHISMDTINDAMKPKVVIRQQTAEGALRQWSKSLVSGKAYDVQSDITHVGSTEWTIDEVENARQALGGVQGSILDVWGGEYEFDNNRIILHKEMGRTAPTVLEYGRNIVSLEYEELIDGVYTSIYPYATYTPKSEDNKQLPDIMVTLDELIIDSEYAGNYETRRIQIVDFSNEFDSNAENPEIPTQAKLRTLAKAYVKNNGYGIPKISQEIDFVDLSKTLDYQDIQVMEEIELNDRVPVYYPNIDAETNDVKVTTTNWDVLNNRYSKITLSTIGAMNTNSITSKLNTAIKDLKAEQKKINNTVPYLINSQGNRVWHTTPDDNMEHKIDDTWFKKNGKYTIIYKWNGSMWEEVLNDETFITEIKAEVSNAKDEADKAVQSAKDADAKAQSALTKAGANANLLDTHQNTLNTINNTTIPAVRSSAQDALASASSAMDEAKKADGKIADYVTKNGLVSGTTVDSKIDTAKGEITGRITTLETNKLDSTTYTNFYNNEYKQTAQGVTDTWTAVNKIIDENGNTTDTFAKAVYDRNAERQTAAFNLVTNNLVTTATYDAGVKGINSSITTIQGKLDNLKIGGRNYFSLTELNELEPSNWVVRAYVYNFKLEPNTEYTLSSNVPSQNGDSSKTNIYFNGSGTAQNGVWENNPVTNTSDENGNIYVAIPTDRPYTKDILDGTYWVQLEKGNLATDWSPAVEDMLGKETFTLFKNEYEDTSSKILNRLTAIDSSEEGSAISRLNEVIKTAGENKNTISKVNKIVTIQDTRNDNQLPKWYRANYPDTTVQEFKIVDTIKDNNIPFSSGFGILTTTIVWGDTSGGTVQQVFSKDDSRYTRRGLTDDSSWTPWVKMTDQEDIKNFVDSTSTEYQKITERSNLYERVIGSSSEASVKQAMSRIVMTDSTFQTEVIDRQNLLTAMASGTGMTDDPYFNKGNNGIGVYDNAGTGTITIRRRLIPSDTTIPIPKGTKGYRLDIVHAGSSATTPNRGGIINSKVSWANGTVVIKFVALLPTGRSFSPANNPLGTGYTLGWLTDNKGTGKWETYMYYYRFGSTGTFSSFGYMSVTGASKAFTWYLSEYDIINVNETSASKITQLADNINLKVSKSDLISQINVQAGGVLITSGTNKLNITPTTTYIQDATIKSAMIESLEADKITTGTLDAGKVKVINLDANNITANKTSFIQSNWNDIESSIRIDGRGLLSTASDGSQVYLQNGIVGARNPNGATIGQIGYAYQTESPWYTMQTSYGSHFQIRMNRGAGELNKQAFYIISGGTESYLNTDNIYLNPASNGRVRVQGAMTVDKDIRAEGAVLVRQKLEYLNGGFIESQSANSNMLIASSNKLIIYTNGSNALEFDANNAVFRRKISDNSDIRLKTNIVDMPINSLEAIRNIEIKKFDYLDGRKNYYGIIAQQAQQYLPELINTDSEGYLMVDKSAMTYVNMHAIQQLNTKVDYEITQLKAQIASLQDELAQLKGA